MINILFSVLDDFIDDIEKPSFETKPTVQPATSGKPKEVNPYRKPNIIQ